MHVTNVCQSWVGGGGGCMEPSEPSPLLQYCMLGLEAPIIIILAHIIIT